MYREPSLKDNLSVLDTIDEKSVSLVDEKLALKTNGTQRV
jgi:hypothetical protein